ncbi:alpha-glucoside-specific PTS transporter subunit IIBC [Niallia circulans]|uniref:Alpha-glucoside-specific PTS transporter subunit IIBC n=1 Tax=Niallia circulans TaxID=1397 RepID=A0A941JN45_NIACI|nr:alpha-glucoside-specific PTS transporter subunit IIBC [Niallia circulans]MCB5238671.1 alpha-glucoside-specific PTS transporter subunit IIBC [Niallia circulans]
MLQKIQRFGGAMFTPVLFFAFSGIMVAIASVFQNPLIMGSLADPNTLWFKVWDIIGSGAWTVFRQMELLFVVGLPIALAKKAHARAVMESLVIYLTFNYFISSILKYFGNSFGIDFAANLDTSKTTGLKLIAGIKTLDTNIIGSIAIAALAVWLHNKYFDKKLPEWLGIFQGSAYVVIIGFLFTLPLAFLTCWIWPMVQTGIFSLQQFFIESKSIGILIYSFLVRILIPTGLHHFIYAPFTLGPAVIKDGIQVAWLNNLSDFAQSKESLKVLFPEGGFTLYGCIKIFAPPGIVAAFYKTAKPENRKKVLALMIPAAITAIVAGITEPLEFTFLFVAPILFVAYSLLGAIMAMIMYQFGISGDFSSGLINSAARNWIPLFNNHWGTYTIQIIIGIAFIFIYYYTFKFLILKLKLATPGRDNAEIKLYSKDDFKNKKINTHNTSSIPEISSQEVNSNKEKARSFLYGLGGAENIDSVSNCATRLRINVKDSSLVEDTPFFQNAGALGLVKKKNAVQVIVGLSVPNVREEFELLLDEDLQDSKKMI